MRNRLRNKQLPAVAGVMAGMLVLAGGDDISSLLLQPAKSTKSGTSIRIFFMFFCPLLLLPDCGTECNGLLNGVKS